jgi:hypothetical protein
MDTNEYFQMQFVIDHVLTSLLGCLIGLVSGGAIGYGLASLSHKVFPSSRKPTFLSTLFPWRTLIAGALLPNIVPLPASLYFGFRPEAGTASVAWIIFLISLVLTISAVRSSPASTSVILQNIPWVRSLAVLAVILTTNFGAWGLGGLGWAMRGYIQHLDYQAAIMVGLWIIGITLTFDLIVGCLEYIVRTRFESKDMPTMTKQETYAVG